MRNDMQEAIDDLKAMAVIIIAHTLGYSDEVVEELLVMKAKDELDDFLQEILEEGK
jgi:energy-coupling factor transporter ATP-binding protein EcfA2